MLKAESLFVICFACFFGLAGCALCSWFGAMFEMLWAGV